jgi:hypothetical protein
MPNAVAFHREKQINTSMAASDSCG